MRGWAGVLCIVAAFAALAGIGAEPVRATAPTFTAIDLGSLGGTFGEAVAINNRGEVVGFKNTAGDAGRDGFYWTSATGMIDLGSFSANSINDDGVAVGSIPTSDGSSFHAALWTSSGGMHDLGTLGGPTSYGMRADSLGRVFGDSDTVSGEHHAFMWTASGGIVDLGTLGGHLSVVTDVSDNGQIVGYSTTATSEGIFHAFRWTDTGGMQDLGTIGGASSFASAVSETGQVAGYGNPAVGSIHAFSWTEASGMVDLGTLGGCCSQVNGPNAVSSTGQVVGASVTGTTSGPGEAFSWTQAGGLLDLGTLGGSQTSAVAVNSSGHVVGEGYITGDAELDAFFWTQPDGIIDLGTLGGTESQALAMNDSDQIVGYADPAGDNSADPVLWQPVATGTPAGFVTRAGTKLLLDGQPFRPIGLNIYNANSNGWCSYAMGGSVLDDSLTSLGAGKNAIRSWFFQQLATTGGSRDWTAFDNTLRAARAHGYKVIATLTDQWGDCGDSTVAGYGYKNTNWYQNAYKQRDPSGTVSYRDWVAEVVTRYKNDPTILAWQLVNEPEVMPYKDADCSTVPESVATSTLSAFATDVSGLIKSIDPYHLVSLGTIGSGQCGAQGDDFQSLMSIPSLDLCEFHDYNPNQLVPGDIYNGLQRRLDQCNALNKPLLIGEEGVDLNPLGGVTSTAEIRRSAIFSDKLCAQFTAGVAGGLLWAWNKNGPTADPTNPVYDIGPGDPVLDVLTPWGDPTHTCAPASAPNNVVAAAGEKSASVSWLPPFSDGGSAISSYIVTSNPGGLTATVNGSLTTASVTGLSNGTAYTFTVTAANGSRTSPASVASNSATPQSGNTAATAIAPSTGSTTVTTGTDPAATGGTTTAVTVPAGTSGGAVLVTQTATNQTAPSGYVFGGVQVDITAPAATASNPLALLFTMTPPAGVPLDQTTLGATNIYRAEGTNATTLIPDCTAPADLSRINPCVSNRQYVTINGATYIQVNVLTTAASHWNSARPKPGAVVVSESGYTPTTVSTQLGGSVGWKFSGKKAHTVTDTIGLGSSGVPLFKSAALTAGSYSFTFPAAGSYPYNSTVKGDSFNGTVAIPTAVTPSSGTTATNFSVIWATNTLANYIFDVQYRFKPVGATGWKSWAAWKTGIAATHATFTPNQGAGTYAFHTRLRNPGNNRASLYSPDITISVS